MVDDRKHSEAVKVWLTEREMLDLARMADREDRKVSELVRVIVRRFMYGNVGCPDADFHGAMSAVAGCEE